jgi:hypothetical protein
MEQIWSTHRITKLPKNLKRKSESEVTFFRKWSKSRLKDKCEREKEEKASPEAAAAVAPTKATLS